MLLRADRAQQAEDLALPTSPAGKKDHIPTDSELFLCSLSLWTDQLLFPLQNVEFFMSPLLRAMLIALHGL